MRRSLGALAALSVYNGLWVCKANKATSGNSHLHQHQQQHNSSVTALALLFSHHQKAVSCDAPVASNNPLGRNGVVSATYPANDPIEDRYTIVRNDEWTVASVFDGHGGFNVSDFASKSLVQMLLNELASGNGKKALSEIEINKIIDDTFNKIENNYLDTVRSSYHLGFGDVASVGSCALVAMKSNLSNKLIIMNLGDCRAVLGSSTSSDAKTLLTTRLTRDHNAREPLEVLRLLQEHPGETVDTLVRCKNEHACYVKGRLQLTRSFGDAYLKYHEFNRKSSDHRSMGRRVDEPFTPPYVTHKPDIFHININENRDKFVILASDGLWDFISDDEAVQIVAQCTDRSQAADLLVECALRRAATESKQSYEALLKLPPGRQRRSKHDDTTAVILYF